MIIITVNLAEAMGFIKPTNLDQWDVTWVYQITISTKHLIIPP